MINYPEIPFAVNFAFKCSLFNSIVYFCSSVFLSNLVLFELLLGLCFLWDYASSGLRTVWYHKTFYYCIAIFHPKDSFPLLPAFTVWYFHSLLFPSLLMDEEGSQRKLCRVYAVSTSPFVTSSLWFKGSKFSFFYLVSAYPQLVQGAWNLK